jgi:hypothetical protein
LVKSLALTSGEWRHDLQASARVLGGSWKQWEFDLPDGVKHSVTVSVDTSAGPVTGTLPAT